jgi:hypothetical protein
MVEYEIMTKDNVPEVSIKTGRNEFDLVKLLIEYSAHGIYPVRVPVVPQYFYNYDQPGIDLWGT